MSTSGIFFKIDWYSAVFESCSINDILEWLSLDHESDDFFSNCFSRALGYDTQLTYGFDGVTISISNSLINSRKASLDDISVFDVVFDRLRLDITGSGLDTLRDKWVELGFHPDNFDMHIRLEPVLPRGVMHITRCDFAFDLIDYSPAFLDTIIDHLLSVPGSRVPICHLQGGLQFSIRQGDQKTVYLGSPRSDRMLRIYDKRKQLTNEDGVWLRSIDYEDPQSWIRIELQTRNKIAHGLCFGDGDPMSIFRYIYENYAFRDFSYECHTCKAVPFWDELFTWDQVPPIVQNLHFAPHVTTIDRAEKYVFGTALRSIFALMAYYGVDHFVDRVTSLFTQMQSDDDYNWQRKWKSSLTCLKSMSFDESLSHISDLKGIDVLNGQYILK